jgi:hypothetical protein
LLEYAQECELLLIEPVPESCLYSLEVLFRANVYGRYGTSIGMLRHASDTQRMQPFDIGMEFPWTIRPPLQCLVDVDLTAVMCSRCTTRCFFRLNQDHWSTWVPPDVDTLLAELCGHEGPQKLDH